MAKIFGQVVKKSLGTIGYQAPEVENAKKIAFEAGPEQDVYSLAIVICQLLEGQINPKKITKESKKKFEGFLEEDPERRSNLSELTEVLNQEKNKTVTDENNSGTILV